MTLTLHFLPGMFASGTGGLLEAMERGSGAFVIRELEVAGEVEHPVPYLDATPPGTVRQAQVRGALHTGVRVGGRLEAHGAKPPGRVVTLLGLEPAGGGETRRRRLDMELAVMGLACGALAHESHGAAVIGSDLPAPEEPTAAGTVAEQVRGVLQAAGERAALVVAAPDTAASLGELPGFARRPLGDLVEYRRF